jgi:hypothetical protein
MRYVNKLVLAGLALAFLPWSAQAGPRWSVNVGIGVPWCGPYYGCYRPYYYYRPYYVVEPAPVVVAPAPVVVQQPVAVVPQAAVTAAPASTVIRAQAPEPPEVERYLQHLDNPDDRARAEAAIQLGRLKVERAVEPLSRMLAADRSPQVRESAARALGLIGSPDATAALQRAAQADDDREVRTSARFAVDVIRASVPPR